MSLKTLTLHILLSTLVIRGTLSYDPESSITGLYTGPYFDPLANKNLSAHLGERATLPCTVRQLGDKSVSWVRMRDADILTVDRYTFVGDERFESRYSEARETWSLIIKYVQERDAGLYECQVSTEPKMSQLFSLRVVVPRVDIAPPGDRYMKAGSRVQIECLLNDVVMFPDYIFWYHGDTRLVENNDPNIVVTIKRTGAESITSTLTILEVPGNANGNYTCTPSNLHSASVILHVLNEKNPEAMQGERSGASNVGVRHLHPLFLLLLVAAVVFCCAFPSTPNDANLQTITKRERRPQVPDQRNHPSLSESPSLLDGSFAFSSHHFSRFAFPHFPPHSPAAPSSSPFPPAYTPSRPSTLDRLPADTLKGKIGCLLFSPSISISSSSFSYSPFPNSSSPSSLPASSNAPSFSTTRTQYAANQTPCSFNRMTPTRNTAGYFQTPVKDPPYEAHARG